MAVSARSPSRTAADTIGRSFCNKSQKEAKINTKRTTPGIRWSSPTQLLVQLSAACLGQSGRDAEFSAGYGRTYCVL